MGAATASVREPRVGVIFGAAAQTWLMLRIGQTGAQSTTQLAESLNAPADRFTAVIQQLRDRGYLASGEPVRFTAAGDSVYEELVSARNRALEAYLADWPAEQRAQMHGVLVSLAGRIFHDDFDDVLRSTAATYNKNRAERTSPGS